MIRMGPVFFIHLLLMAPLLQHTEENEELGRQKPPKRDEAVHHQEFCLSIPEAPHSTSLVFETPQPTKSASKPKLTKQKPKSPKQPDVHRSPISGEENYPSAGVPEIVPMRSPMSGERNDPSAGVPEIEPMIAPISLHSPDVKVSDGCYCKDQNKKLSTEIYRVSSLIIHYPSETCRSTEYIEILKDGRKVCVMQFSLVTHFLRFLSKPVPEQRSTESPEISSTTHQTTTAETSTSTHLTIRTDGPPLLSDSYMHNGPDGPKGVGVNVKIHIEESHLMDSSGSRFKDPTETCVTCIHLVTWNNFDLKDVQLVDVNFLSSKCPALILLSVSLTDGRHICMDSTHPEFQQLLEKLEIKEP
ncbi:PREDICTED: uncharacterized protein LOC106917172 [Poecilia mexicana]|uniref:uncharacterized protein LOC106917172 n=1 Tax=Poecilia mexicana TaxID=48701 RepID=UPI00072DD1CC|nr:PREDICTED: uncharacterized protein LOC106917172 [Poecilia mexicana]